MPSVLKYFVVVAALAFGIASSSVTAQVVANPKYNSPFSRFGLGDLVPNAYATQLGMGGIGQGFSDAHIGNPSNPASLGALRYATYQVGVDLASNNLDANGQQSNDITGNLRYLSLAFTTRNTLNDLLDARERKFRYATLMSVTPYSTQGYNIELAETREDIGSIVSAFRGTGGFYQLRSAHALEIGTKLRVGASLSYLFGRTDAQTSIRTNDLPGASGIFDTELLRARGVEMAVGGQYDIVLDRQDGRPSRALTLGATLTATTDLKGSTRRSITRQNTFNVIDTLVFNEDAAQRIDMPNGIAVGVFYRVVSKWALGADVAYLTWDGFESTFRPGERLTSGFKVALGGEWIPDFQQTNKFHRIVRYRAGVYFDQDPRPGVDADRGVTLGFGLPVFRPREELSYVNLSLNAGALATPGAIDQRYLRLTVGFALTDNSWFYKRRFK